MAPLIRIPRRTARSGRASRILVVMGFVTVIGIIATLVTGSITDSRERDTLLALVRTAQTAIPYEDLALLSGSQADLVNPAYIRIKQTMTEQREASPDVRFVYLLGQRADRKVFFYGDSEPADSPDNSAPGDVYGDATDADIAGFTKAQAFVEGPARDEWGEWVSALTPISDPQTGRVAALLGMDISTKLLHQRVREAQALPVIVTLLILTMLLGYYLRLRQTELLERTKTEFVSLAAHQLRTPLTSIGWYSEMLMRGEAGPVTPQQAELLGQINDGNKRMVNIVNALLNVSRSDMGTLSSTPKRIELVAEVNKVLTDYEKIAAEKGVAVSRRLPKEEFAITADPELIKIVLQNLLSNAVKYTPKDGKVTVSLTRDQRSAHLTVSDTGYGIPKAQQKNVFTKLFRAQNILQKDTDGSGLGLYLTKSIVDAHGGRIWFASVEGKGSSFYVDLPLDAAK